MYTALLVVHSWLRWVVVFSGIAALGGAVGGATTRRPWLRVDDLRSRIFTIGLDVQVLVGLILYGGLSPLTRAGFADMGSVMRDPVLRFYVVEHLVGMVAALALAHVGRARLRKTADPAARHRTLLVFVGLSLAVVLLSTPWPGMAGGRALFRGL